MPEGVPIVWRQSRLPRPVKYFRWLARLCPRGLTARSHSVGKGAEALHGLSDAAVHFATRVIVNTCGFLDSAQAESLEAIGSPSSWPGQPRHDADKLVQSDRNRHLEQPRSDG